MGNGHTNEKYNRIIDKKAGESGTASKHFEIGNKTLGCDH